MKMHQTVFVPVSTLVSGSEVTKLLLWRKS